MANGDQVKNGKAFEYAIALEYHRYLRSKDIKVEFLEDKAFKTARSFFNSFDEEQQQLFCLSARKGYIPMASLTGSSDTYQYTPLSTVLGGIKISF